MTDRFYMLKYGIAIAWLNELYGGKFPITVSLGFIATATATALSVLASLLSPGRHRSAQASAIPGAR